MEARAEGLYPLASHLALCTVLGKVITPGGCVMELRSWTNLRSNYCIPASEGTQSFLPLGLSFLFCKWGPSHFVWSIWHRNFKKSAQTKLTLNISLHKALSHSGKSLAFVVNHRENWDLHSDSWGLQTLASQEVPFKACCSNRQKHSSPLTGSLLSGPCSRAPAQ